MRVRRLWLGGLPLVLVAATASAQSRDIGVEAMRGEKRVALVIGNAAYPSSPLRNPVNDARAMAQTLRGLGFEVLARENVGDKDLKRAIEEFGDRLRGGGVGLFFYAGHGLQVAGRNYLVPVNAQIRTERDVDIEAIDVARVLARMDEARNRLNIVVLDACRDNAFGRSFRSSTRGLAAIDAPSGTLIAYATSPGRLARDGEGSNGLYTGELLRAMRETGLKLEDVFKRVRQAVRVRTSGEQIPWEASSVEGDFFFVLPRVAAATPGPSPTPPHGTQRAEEWAKLEAERRLVDEQRKALAEERRRSEEEVERQRLLAATQREEEARREREALERKRHQIRDWLRAWNFTADYAIQCRTKTPGKTNQSPRDFSLVVTDISESGDVTAEFTVLTNREGDVGVKVWKGIATGDLLELRAQGTPLTKDVTVVSRGTLQISRNNDTYAARFSYVMETKHPSFLIGPDMYCRHELSYSGPLR